MNQHDIKRQTITLLLVMLTFSFNPSRAASPTEIDIKADAALATFKEKVSGADSFLEVANGILIFPDNLKAGIGIGGEYGEGVLRINNQSVGYYSITGISLGVQLGGQSRSVIIIFLEEEALKKFQNTPGWEIGVDGSVAFIDVGAGKSINSTNIDDPIVGFALSHKGLMFNLTLEGSRIKKLEMEQKASN